MARFMFPDWVSDQAYTSGARVNFNGVTYNAQADVTSTTDPSQDETNWTATAVSKIQDYNSLYEAIRLELNIDSKSRIVDSIPLFIQLTEESFKTRIRAPQQRRSVILTIDSQGRVQAPSDLLQVINFRLNSTTSAVFGQFSRASIEIQNGDYEQFQEIRQYYQGENEYEYYLDKFDTAVYWFDNRYFNIAPLYEAGQEVELVYYGVIPQLGETINLTNEAGMPINSAGQTSAEWVAAGGTNTAGNFVQGTQLVTRNWFTAAAPQMLFYGALLKAQAFLKDDPRIPIWQEMYNQAEFEIHDMIDKFQNNQEHALELQNAYSK